MREKSSRSLPIPYRIGSRLHRHIGLRAPRYVISFPNQAGQGCASGVSTIHSRHSLSPSLLCCGYHTRPVGMVRRSPFEAPVTRRLALVTW